MSIYIPSSGETFDLRKYATLFYLNQQLSNYLGLTGGSINGNMIISGSLTLPSLSNNSILYCSNSGLISSKLITNDNIDAKAGIEDSKLTQITTANKVADSALPSSMANKTLTGTTTTTGVLNFNNQVQNKVICLWGNTIQSEHNYFGMGLSDNTLRYHIDGTGSSHVFYCANGPD